MPIAIAPIGPTKPEAGVIVASPATQPVTSPTEVGLPSRTHSRPIQESAADEAARWVARIAEAAVAFAASALPPLKPNQPTHSMPAPAIVRPGLCGGPKCAGKPRRLPMRIAAISAETPAVVRTTKPPAKSSAPGEASQPPPHTQDAT